MNSSLILYHNRKNISLTKCCKPFVGVGKKSWLKVPSVWLTLWYPYCSISFSLFLCGWKVTMASITVMILLFNSLSTSHILCAEWCSGNNRHVFDREILRLKEEQDPLLPFLEFHVSMALWHLVIFLPWKISAEGLLREALQINLREQ